MDGDLVFVLNYSKIDLSRHTNNKGLLLTTAHVVALTSLSVPLYSSFVLSQYFYVYRLQKLACVHLNSVMRVTVESPKCLEQLLSLASVYQAI